MSMQITFDSYDPADERRRGSLFALGNGVLFVRATPIEVEGENACHYPGTYHAACYNRRILSLDGETLGHDSLVNLPNWLPLQFRVQGDTEWFSLQRCEVLNYCHHLDMAGGLVERRALVRDAAGRLIRFREQRLVSMVRPSLAALRLELTPEDWSGVLELRTAIDGTVTNHNTDRHSLPGYRHLDVIRAAGLDDHTLLLAVRTRQSGIEATVATRLRPDRPTDGEIRQDGGLISEHSSCTVAAGAALTVEKTASIVTYRDPAVAAPDEAAQAVIADAPRFDVLRQEQAASWRRLWDRVAMEIDDAELQRATSFHVFHLLQTLSPHSAQVDVGLPSRGWQEAYHGQIFWDEIFAFPFLNHRFPEIARGILLYRYRRLAEARRAALAAGYAGAMFPWRSATTGAEETPRFQPNPLSRRWMPDHTRLQRHIGAAIAHNIWYYYLATGDDSFLAEYGAEMIIEIARFWVSIAQHDPRDDRYDICGVIGPDEYHNAYPGSARPGLDNNAYTNVMAALTLRRACEVLDLLPPGLRQELTRALNVSAGEIAHWDRVARRLRLCLHRDGVLSQFAGFDRLKPFDGPAFAAQHPNDRLDWMLEARGDTVNAYQVTKQADVLMLLYLLEPEELIAQVREMGYPMDKTQLRRTAFYYLDRISHESSLSRVVCAGALARLDPRASWTFFQRSLCIDLDVSNSTSAEEGLHLGAMSGTLDVLQRHYLGLHLRREGVTLSPAPPPGLGPVRLGLRQRGALLRLEWDGTVLRMRSDAANAATVPVQCDGRVKSLAPGATLALRPGAVTVPQR
ncbi:MAG TPA: glycoside hydrolase family 65 protein [Acetobacteraceae bacterium]